jgi:phage FluMu gp28-like protein
MVPERAQEFPEALKGKPLEEVFLPYQRQAANDCSVEALTVFEKSRRIGITWCIAAMAALTASSARSAGGMDVLYMGFEREMTREFIDTCAMWAKVYDMAARDVEEFVFKDEKPGEETRDILAFRIRFASGFEITALSSNPSNFRGRQGMVIIDEAAFMDNVEATLKAALALVMWGGRIVVISTHNGAENPFNNLIQEIRAGERLGKVVRITFDQAVEDGLYKRICLKTGKPWTQKGEDAWIAQIRGLYKDNAEEELDVVPARSGGTYFPRTLIEARMRPGIPVVRLSLPDSYFLKNTEEARAAMTLDWCRENLGPILAKLDPSLDHAFGLDFGRSVDLSALAPFAIGRDLVRRMPFLLEMRNVPFSDQLLIICYIADRLPRFRKAILDARGIGAALAEAVQSKYGVARIEALMLTANWYIDNMPKVKQAFTDQRLELPADPDLITDLRMFKVEKGVAKIPDSVREKGKDGGSRHGDAGMAMVLGFVASTSEFTEIDFASTGERKVFNDMPESDLGFSETGFGTVSGNLNLTGF